MRIVFAGYVLTAGWADGLLYVLDFSDPFTFTFHKNEGTMKSMTSTNSIWDSVGHITERRN